jgi:hypothetical protein
MKRGGIAACAHFHYRWKTDRFEWIRAVGGGDEWSMCDFYSRVVDSYDLLPIEPAEPADLLTAQERGRVELHRATTNTASLVAIIDRLAPKPVEMKPLPAWVEEFANRLEACKEPYCAATELREACRKAMKEEE